MAPLGKLAIITAGLTLWGATFSGEASAFVLNDECPASFERSSTNSCEFRSLYQMYKAPPGYGGLRAPLPELRDGFTPQQIDLGRYLFFDPILSGAGNISCATCHIPAKGFADGKPLPVGATGEELRRSAPSLWNVGFLKTLFWDGRADRLESQAAGPLFDPKEMANTPDRLEASINANEIYRTLFGEAFLLTSAERIETSHIVTALAAFQSSLVSVHSRYDRYAHGDETALNDDEKSGHNIFRSFVTRCSQCHAPPLFTIDELATTGVPGPDHLAFDTGAQEITGDPYDRGAFKIPTLRNIAQSAPYMHAGSIDNLNQAIQFYNNKRGHAVRENETLHLHWHIALQEKTLSDEEVFQLEAFLISLTDISTMPQIPEQVPSGLSVVTQRK